MLYFWHGFVERRESVLQLTPFVLRLPKDWELFYQLFTAYLAEVCNEEEYAENMADLQDADLNAQLIRQTFQEKDPYFVLKIEQDGGTAGLVSFSYREEQREVFLNNLYILPQYRKAGLGTAVCKTVENRAVVLGACQIRLAPVENARGFYLRLGFRPEEGTPEGQAFVKEIKR